MKQKRVFLCNVAFSLPIFFSFSFCFVCSLGLHFIWCCDILVSTTRYYTSLKYIFSISSLSVSISVAATVLLSWDRKKKMSKSNEKEKKKKTNCHTRIPLNLTDPSELNWWEWWRMQDRNRPVSQSVCLTFILWCFYFNTFTLRCFAFLCCALRPL